MHLAKVLSSLATLNFAPPEPCMAALTAAAAARLPELSAAAAAELAWGAARCDASRGAVHARALATALAAAGHHAAADVAAGRSSGGRAAGGEGAGSGAGVPLSPAPGSEAHAHGAAPASLPRGAAGQGGRVRARAHRSLPLLLPVRPTRLVLHHQLQQQASLPRHLLHTEEDGAAGGVGDVVRSGVRSRIAALLRRRQGREELAAGSGDK